jgi:hypothetical protein
MGGVAKEYITKLGCEKYFDRVTYSALLEMLLPLSKVFKRVWHCMLEVPHNEEP